MEVNDNSNSDNSDFAFCAGKGSHSNSNTDAPITNDVKFKDASSLEEMKIKKRPYSKVSLEKQLEEEEYNRKVGEQRYKRLMHLLNKSQFYSSYLLTKIENSMKKQAEEKEVIKEKSEPAENNENKRPVRKRKGNSQKYNMEEYITVDIKAKLQNKRAKLNLSKENIEAELCKDSDTEMEESTGANVVPKYFHNDLYDYQHEGLKWLKVLYENGLNGILGDEMGLGKTIQVIALFCHLIEKQQSGPYLIIAPLSTLPNWMLEFERFAPDIPIVIFHGPKEERPTMYSKIRNKYQLKGTDYKTQPVVITSFEVPLHEIKFLQSQKWRYIVLDEGHRIKNYNCQLVKVLKTCHFMNKLLLTGTPLQNNLSELWSLLNFLLPDIFDDLAVFESWFDIQAFQNKEDTEKFLKQEEEKQIVTSLREILKPFLLRRIKSEVNLEIPPKKELVVYTPFTELQYDLYTAVLNRDIHALSKIEETPLIIPTVNGKRIPRRCVLRNKNGYNMDNYENNIVNGISPSTSNESLNSEIDDEKDKWKATKAIDHQSLSIWNKYTNITDRNRDFFIRIHFSNRISMYKKIVNHPYLVHCPLDSVGLPQIDENLVKSSGKLLVLDAMFAKLKARGHRVLLFSTMTMILDMIEDYLSLRDYEYLRLDGTTKLEVRKEYIARFNTDQNIFLFLVSTRAGGVGLNLAGADTVIIYDSDWNPQVDIQAMARCHRIGQTKPVVVYRLCTKATIDETIIKRAEAKRILEKMVISKKWSSSTFDKKTLLELKQLIESKEYKVVTSSKEIFTDAELDKLLDRSDMFNSDNIAIDDSKE